MINCAYDPQVVPIVQRLLGGMLDFAVYGLEMKIEDFYASFLKSSYAEKIERIDSRTVMGTSGIELCYEITGRDALDSVTFGEYEMHMINGRSPEYWSGWALAYYQWKTALHFSDINDVMGIDTVLQMYRKYHEMDITQFADRMDELYRKKNPDTRLKTMRKRLGLSQRELAERTGIPIKTIQQYEQKQKNINHARVDYVINLSKALICEPAQLMEMSLK